MKVRMFLGKDLILFSMRAGMRAGVVLQFGIWLNKLIISRLLGLWK